MRTRNEHPQFLIATTTVERPPSFATTATLLYPVTIIFVRIITGKPQSDPRSIKSDRDR